jgi:hypothetical protein
VVDPQAPRQSSPVRQHALHGQAASGSPASRSRSAGVDPSRRPNDPDALARTLARSPTIGGEDHEKAFETLRVLSARLLNMRPSGTLGLPEGRTAAALHSFVELGERMCSLIGTQGYRALVERALHLATREFPLLKTVRPGIASPGMLVGLPKGSRHVQAKEVPNAVVATLARLLWLLEQFLGNDLTERIVLEVWPWAAECGSGQRQLRS